MGDVSEASDGQCLDRSIVFAPWALFSQGKLRLPLRVRNAGGWECVHGEVTSQRANRRKRQQVCVDQRTWPGATVRLADGDLVGELKALAE
jgi:hypothetical protein